jgi:hypothetical protein
MNHIPKLLLFLNNNNLFLFHKPHIIHKKYRYYAITNCKYHNFMQRLNEDYWIHSLELSSSMVNV